MRLRTAGKVFSPFKVHITKSIFNPLSAPDKISQENLRYYFINLFDLLSARFKFDGYVTEEKN